MAQTEPTTEPKAKAQRISAITASALILPNGVEIAPGASVELPAEFATNAGVLSWVADGLAEISDEE